MKTETLYNVVMGGNELFYIMLKLMCYQNSEDNLINDITTENLFYADFKQVNVNLEIKVNGQDIDIDKFLNNFEELVDKNIEEKAKEIVSNLLGNNRFDTMIDKINNLERQIGDLSGQMEYEIENYNKKKLIL